MVASTGAYAREVEQRFGERVRALREARGWTQAELADLMTQAGYAMHQTQVARLEAGKRPTSVAELAALARLFGIKIDEMLSNKAAPLQTLDELAELEARANNLVHQIAALDAAAQRLAGERRRVDAELAKVTKFIERLQKKRG